MIGWLQSLVVFAMIALVSPAGADTAGGMSASQCAKNYLATRDGLIQCIGMVPTDARKEVSEYCNNALKEAQDPRPRGYQETVGLAIKNLPCSKEESVELFVAITEDKLFESCLQKAQARYKADHAACATSAPDLYGSSCPWLKTINTVCHSKCSGGACKHCQESGFSVAHSCATPVGQGARASGAAPCQDAFAHGRACRKTCETKLGTAKGACRADCEAQERLMWDTCWLARGEDPPPSPGTGPKPPGPPDTASSPPASGSRLSSPTVPGAPAIKAPSSGGVSAFGKPHAPAPTVEKQIPSKAPSFGVTGVPPAAPAVHKSPDLIKMPASVSPATAPLSTTGGVPAVVPVTPVPAAQKVLTPAAPITPAASTMEPKKVQVQPVAAPVQPVQKLQLKMPASEAPK